MRARGVSTKVRLDWTASHLFPRWHDLFGSHVAACSCQPESLLLSCCGVPFDRLANIRNFLGRAARLQLSPGMCLSAQVWIQNWVERTNMAKKRYPDHRTTGSHADTHYSRQYSQASDRTNTEKNTPLCDRRARESRNPSLWSATSTQLTHSARLRTNYRSHTQHGNHEIENAVGGCEHSYTSLSKCRSAGGERVRLCAASS